MTHSKLIYLKSAAIRILVLSLVMSLGSPVLAQSASKRASRPPRGDSATLPRASPEQVGMSSERLGRIRSVVEKSVSEGRIAGAVTLVMRHGKVAHLEAIGHMDQARPMSEDAIFRIASMTKAITSVAVMILLEEGKLLLSDPVSRYIPEFKDARVAIPGDDKKAFTLVPARSPITIRHLLTHTSGITYRFIGVEPWASLYREAGVSDGLTQTEGTISDNIRKLAGLPLMHHPGDKFSYGLSTDVLGYLIEVVSGMTLDEFFRKRVFEPLRMNDTHFFLPSGKLARLAAVYNQTADGGIKRMSDEPDAQAHLIYSASYPYKGPRTYYSGGAGLLSTISDYARFLQMLLNGGQLDGVRVLSRKTIELMTVDHVGDKFGSQGFGLGFRVIDDLGQSGEPGSVSQYGWGGFFYTNFFVDPQEKMIGVFMSQLFPNGDLRMHERFRTLAYQAIID